MTMPACAQSTSRLHDGTPYRVLLWRRWWLIACTMPCPPRRQGGPCPVAAASASCPVVSAAPLLLLAAVVAVVTVGLVCAVLRMGTSPTGTCTCPAIALPVGLRLSYLDLKEQALHLRKQPREEERHGDLHDLDKLIN